MGVVIIKNGKFFHDGESFIPVMGDARGTVALKASAKAQELRVSVTKGSTGKWPRETFNVSMSITCPYCGSHIRAKGTASDAFTAQKGCEGKLYPVDCICGAEYGKLNSANAKQINQ